MRRGESGLSLVVGVNKPAGMTSHDVVNRCRRIFGEKRVGHTGTLDPMASGAMAVLVGPATKLSNYLTAHDKVYRARIVFGSATDTDDAEGTVIRRADVPDDVSDTAFAMRKLASIVGPQSQMPPVYSAIKVNGVKSYEAARKGKIIDLRPRQIEIRDARLDHMGPLEDGVWCWDVTLEVSAGTYVRSIARDLGRSCGTCAHLGSLERLASGRLEVGSCVTLETLESDSGSGVLDPVELLGMRFAAVDGTGYESAVRNGGAVDAGGLQLLELMDEGAHPECLPAAIRSEGPLLPGELVAVLIENKLVALYEYDGDAACLRARCGFSQGVSRGIV